MKTNHSPFHFFHAWCQAAREAMPNLTTASLNAPERRRVEPYMESLPTRRPAPRRWQQGRAASFMQLGIDG